MLEIAAEDRLLFLRYALPCAGTLVRRGSVSAASIEAAERAVASGSAPAGAEACFKVALAACSLRAKDAGKERIDAAVIREYFRSGHDAVIDARYAEMGDFDPEACRVRAGRVLSVRAGKAVVTLPGGERSCRMDFVPEARPGEWVLVHWGFLVEPVSAAEAQRINGSSAKER